jgi:hypothetical protein
MWITVVCKQSNPVKMVSLGIPLIVHWPGFKTFLCIHRPDESYASFAQSIKTTTYQPSQEVKEQIFWYSFISRSENLVRGFIIIHTFISW